MNYLNLEVEHTKYGKGLIISRSYQAPYADNENMYLVFFFNEEQSFDLNIEEERAANRIRIPSLTDKNERLKQGTRERYQIEYKYVDYYYQRYKFGDQRNEISDLIIALKKKSGVELYKAEKKVEELLFEILPDHSTVCVVPSSTAGKKTSLEGALDNIADTKDITVLKCFVRSTSRLSNNKGGKRTPKDIRNGVILQDSQSIKGQEIILLDDICTSGSTFRAFSDLLYEHGAAKVDCICLGSTIVIDEYNRETQLFALLQVPGLGRKTVNKILEDNQEIGFAGCKKTIQIIESYSKKNSRIKVPTEDEYMSYLCKADEVFAKHRDMGIDIIPIGSKYYPKAFYLIDSPPILLYAKGNINLLKNEDFAAVIGSRKATKHGESVAKRLGEVLAKAGETIVSGLALGCDTNAHVGCLDADGKTIAILPSPIDDITPKSNTTLANKIVESGGLLLSEYYSGQDVINAFYAERDRLQSGLSNGVIVVETSSNGGTMITVKNALKYGKVVGCYVHPAKYSSYSELSGNRQLLMSREVVHIDSSEAIELFIKKMQSVKEAIRNTTVDETKQISFDF